MYITDKTFQIWSKQEKEVTERVVKNSMAIGYMKCIGDLVEVLTKVSGVNKEVFKTVLEELLGKYNQTLR